MAKKSTPAQLAKAAKLAQELGGYDEKALRSYVMREIGRGGWSKAGQASAAKMTPEQRSDRARKASLSRRPKTP